MDEDTLVAAGFDCAPFLFKESAGEWYVHNKPLACD